MRRPVAPLLLVLFALALAGCGPAGGAWLVVLVALALAVAGCSESHTVGPDGEVVEPDGAPDPWDAGGPSCAVSVRCCQDGLLASCCCSADASCNYGLGMIECGDGTCGYEWEGSREEICGEVPDAGVDAGGDWEPCCDDATGTIDSCFCPAGVECNYGLFRTCDDGRCTSFGACPEDDAGPAIPDAGAA